MYQSETTVYIIDNDKLTCESIGRLARGAGLHAQAYHRPLEFLGTYREGVQDCIITELMLPQMSGLELYSTLLSHHIDTPVIFLTRYGEVADAVRAMKMGAADFLQKPFEAQNLLGRIQKSVSMAGQV